MVVSLTLVIIIIGLALIFDFLNGFHDSANAISTIVVTKALTPLQAVLLAGFANFIGYFIFGFAVAATVGKGIVDSSYVTLSIILAALIGAIIWNLITWGLGLPTSSSHALIGGLIGSSIAAFGLKSLVFAGIAKVVLFILLAPLIGMFGAMIFTVIVLHLSKNSNPFKAQKFFKKLQLISATFYSIGHGTNDAQKTMGIITLTLFTAGLISTFKVTSTIALASHLAIALGTTFGGWRIVKTMGTKITKIREMEGFCAESSSAFVLFGATHAGIPVSTTHVITGSIMGVGSIENSRKVKWIVARKIIYAWILTIPITALCSALTYFLISLFIV